jgi:hypothetical protein
MTDPLVVARAGREFSNWLAASPPFPTEMSEGITPLRGDALSLRVRNPAQCRSDNVAHAGCYPSSK